MLVSSIACPSVCVVWFIFLLMFIAVISAIINIIVINIHIPFNIPGKTTSRKQLFMKSYIDYLESIQDKFVVCLGDLNASRDGNRGGHNFLEEIKRFLKVPIFSL